jgi:hypothetical protein
MIRAREGVAMSPLSHVPGVLATDARGSHSRGRVSDPARVTPWILIHFAEHPS